MELFYREDYSTEPKPKLVILDSLFEEEFSITEPSGCKMGIIVK